MASTVNPPQPGVLTVGHSNHPWDVFVGLLQRHAVTALVDVRSVPYSRFNPQFNRNRLERELPPCGVRYVFLGRELGARSDDPACYDETGRVQYDRLARKPAFRLGLDRIVQETARNRVALMCAEKEPLSCHRTILVAPALERRGVEIEHILVDGTLEPHAHALHRLIDGLKLPAADLFRSRDALVAEALTRRAARVGYVDPEFATARVSSNRKSKR